MATKADHIRVAMVWLVDHVDEADDVDDAIDQALAIIEAEGCLVMAGADDDVWQGCECYQCRRLRANAESDMEDYTGVDSRAYA